ncbi:MAG: TonB-dependent receptor [Pseudomonadota bacterium]
MKQNLVLKLTVGSAALMAATYGTGYAQTAVNEQAGTDDDDVIVVTATRRAQKINEIARSVIVIDPEALEVNLAKTSNVADILGLAVPGFGAPTQNDLIRTNTLRGREPQYLIDGVPLDFNGGSAFRTSPLTKFDPETLGQIEVLYGPTSIYGAGAAGGVIQFFTREAADKPIEAELRHQIQFYPGAPQPLDESSLSWKSSGLISGTIENFDYVAQVSFDAQNAQFDGEGNISGPTYFGFYDTTNYFLKAGYDITPTQRLQAVYNLTELEEDDRTLEFLANDSGEAIAVFDEGGNTITYNENEPSDEKQFFTIRYDHTDLFGGAFSAVYYNRKDELISPFIDLRLAQLVFIAEQPEFPDNYQTLQVFEGSGFRVQYSRDVGERFSFIVGADYDEQEINQTSFVYQLPPDFSDTLILGPVIEDLFFTRPVDLETFGVFVQGDFEVTDKLRLTAGLRYEEPDFSIEGGITTFEQTYINGTRVSRLGAKGSSDGFAYNIGFTYDVTTQFTAYANFAQAVELPSLISLGRLLPVEGQIQGDEAIEPQIIDNYEAGFRGAFGPVNYSFAAFFSESEFGETFQFDADGFGEYLRAPEEIYGLEIAADWEVTDSFNLSSAFSWSEGEFDADGDGPGGFAAISSLEIQPWKATIFGDYQFNDKTSANFQLLAIGDRDSALEDGTDTFEIEGYYLLDAGLVQEVPFGVVSLQVTNLLDRQYLTPASQTYRSSAFFNSRVNPAPGRAITIAYQATF